ncbi:MAG: cation:proton antiporter [Phycisphaerales bacterium]|jgi:CPA2 family monovalent cation:H+ antiporter-2|nr:cation:proton antiporter [Phycisphaerales bacterium]
MIPSLAPTLAASISELSLLTTLAAGLAAAWALGLLTKRLGLSPIVGYLLGGVVIGPYTPGFVGDEKIAHQLAEIGVILMMFGVGLHFKLKDLLAVRRIAIPGAIVQSLAATIVGTLVFLAFGWHWQSGMVIGMAMAVASTVVLLRVLMDRQMLATPHGHAAVGWLLVEDVFTVLALVFVPMLAVGEVVEESARAGPGVVMTILIALAKLGVLVAIVLLAGSRVVPWLLARVARLRSRELFTLTVLVLSIAIAVGSAAFFGVSVALGAFLAGMVVAQSPTSHQAAADALPLRDAFAVLFFVAVGMLFDPHFVLREPLMLVAGLAIVMVIKPIAALAIVSLLGYPGRTALTVALGLAQIGEFSFILGQVALNHAIIPPDAQHILVGTAMVSITLNPILFGSIDRIEAAARRVPWFWRLLDGRAEKRRRAVNDVSAGRIAEATKPLAIIVGYGPVGRLVDGLLRDAGFHTVVVEMNLRSVETLAASGRSAIFGDATRPDILDEAGIRRARYLVMTLPHSESRSDLVHIAREMNPDVEIIMRARYLAEADALANLTNTMTVYEEGETGLALARRVMELREIEPAKIDAFLDSVRTLWRLQAEKKPAGATHAVPVEPPNDAPTNHNDARP